MRESFWITIPTEPTNANNLLVGKSDGATVINVALSKPIGSILQTQENGVNRLALVSPIGNVLKVISNGAISIGAIVYGAANGKVSSTGNEVVGRALTNAIADGDTLLINSEPCSA